MQGGAKPTMGNDIQALRMHRPMFFFSLSILFMRRGVESGSLISRAAIVLFFLLLLSLRTLFILLAPFLANIPLFIQSHHCFFIFSRSFYGRKQKFNYLPSPTPTLVT